VARPHGDAVKDDAGESVRCGPYRIESRLATGGMAEVYLARDESPEHRGRIVVVKRLRRNVADDPTARNLFDREAALHAVVKHENVVAVYGSGVASDGEPYLAMELVDGVDCHRLLARLNELGTRVPVEVCVYVMRDVLRALASVHAAADERGQPMGMIHRDVTPSNIYVSKDGRVKLGDFGIARSTSRMTMDDAEGALPKGKFAYLSPEQIAGKSFDHRADLFSAATCLAELLIGKRLFSGNGYLSILLAIQECRLDTLWEAKDLVPAGLFQALLTGLAREPDERFQSAPAFSAALVPFQGDPVRARAEVVRLVGRAYVSPFAAKGPFVVRDSATTMRAVRAGRTLPGAREPAEPLELDLRDLPSVPDSDPRLPRAMVADTGKTHVDEEEATHELAASAPSFVETSDGRRLGPWAFARLIEGLMTGEIGHDDRVRYLGKEAVLVGEIPALARFLPARPAGPRDEVPPEWKLGLSSPGMVSSLLRILRERATGMLVATRPDGEPAEHKELYFVDGRLHHAISSNVRELFGQWLLRRGVVGKAELQRALAALPAFNGRIGDALIGLGLLSAVDTLHALREQACERVAALFSWKGGQLAFHRGVAAKDVELPLDVDVPRLVLLGLHTARTDAATLEEYRGRLDGVVGLAAEPPALFAEVTRPPLVARVVRELAEPKSLRELVYGLELGGEVTAGDAIHAVELLAAARCIRVVG